MHNKRNLIEKDTSRLDAEKPLVSIIVPMYDETLVVGDTVRKEKQ